MTTKVGEGTGKMHLVSRKVIGIWKMSTKDYLAIMRTIVGEKSLADQCGDDPTDKDEVDRVIMLETPRLCRGTHKV